MTNQLRRNLISLMADVAEVPAEEWTVDLEIKFVKRFEGLVQNEITKTKFSAEQEYAKFLLKTKENSDGFSEEFLNQYIVTLLHLKAEPVVITRGEPIDITLEREDD